MRTHMRTITLVAILPFLSTGCIWGQLKDAILGSDTAVPDGDTDNEFCTNGGIWQGEFSSGFHYYDEIVAVCVWGHNSSLPTSFSLTVPGSENDPSDDYEALATFTDFEPNNVDPDMGVYRMLFENEDGTPLMSDKATDDTIWPWYHYGNCSLGVWANFAMRDGQSTKWTDPDGKKCQQVFGQSALGSMVLSGQQACVPGTADFTTAVRTVLAYGANESTVVLTPLLEQTGSFPEAAWLRQIEVVDWGDATNIHYGEFQQPLSADEFVLAGTGIERPSPGSPPSITSFAVGERPMSTQIGVEHMPNGGTLPTLRLSWSCQVDPEEPHVMTVPGMSPFVTTLPEISPVQSRIVFWIADDGANVRLAPEGRYMDYVQSDLALVIAGERSFEFHLESYNASLEGMLVRDGLSYRLENLVATIDGEATVINDKILAPL